MRLFQDMIDQDKSRKTILSAKWKQLDVFSKNIKQNELRGTKIEEQNVILQRIKVQFMNPFLTETGKFVCVQIRRT